MRILISACLLGVACRYDGESRPLDQNIIAALRERYELIPICPEQLGGLMTPRDPSERQGDRVISKSGQDVTEAYRRGAEQALYLAKVFSCSAAILKEKSPSCGHGQIYDGTFQKRLVHASGVTAELLVRHGIRVCGESDLEAMLS